MASNPSILLSNDNQIRSQPSPDLTDEILDRMDAVTAPQLRVSENLTFDTLAIILSLLHESKTFDPFHRYAAQRVTRNQVQQLLQELL